MILGSFFFPFPFRPGPPAVKLLPSPPTKTARDRYLSSPRDFPKVCPSKKNHPPPKSNPLSRPRSITFPRAHQFNPRYRSPPTEFWCSQNAPGRRVNMTGVGLEVLLEDLIPEIALSGDKGTPHSPSRTTNRCCFPRSHLHLDLEFHLGLFLEAATGRRMGPRMRTGHDGR